MSIKILKEILTQDVIDVLKKVRNRIGYDYRISYIAINYDQSKKTKYCEIELILPIISFDTMRLVRKRVKLYGNDATVIDEFVSKILDKFGSGHKVVRGLNLALELCGIKCDLPKIKW